MSLEEAVIYIAEHIEGILDGFTALWLVALISLFCIVCITGGSCISSWLSYRMIKKGYKEGKIELRSDDYMSVKELFEQEKRK